MKKNWGGCIRRLWGRGEEICLQAFCSYRIMHLLTCSKLPWLLRLKVAFKSWPHPPYSPDLAPSDVSLFPKLKSNLCSRNFGSIKGVIDEVNEYLRDQDEDFYFEGISKLEQQWRKCIKLKGDYIEEKYWQTFHSWVFRSTWGLDLYDHTSYLSLRKGHVLEGWTWASS